MAIITSLGADNLQKRLEGARAALKAHPDMTIVEEFDVKDDAVRVAEVIASASQRYPDLDGWLSVGGWPVFVRNALDPVDPARTKVVAFDTIPPAPDLLRAGKVQLLVGQKYFGWGEESVRLLKRHRRRPSARGGLPLLRHRRGHAREPRCVPRAVAALGERNQHGGWRRTRIAPVAAVTRRACPLWAAPPVWRKTLPGKYSATWFASERRGLANSRLGVVAIGST